MSSFWFVPSVSNDLSGKKFLPLDRDRRLLMAHVLIYILMLVDSVCVCGSSAVWTLSRRSHLSISLTGWNMSSNHAVTIITFLCPPCSLAVLGLLWMFLSVLHLMEGSKSRLYTTNWAKILREKSGLVILSWSTKQAPAHSWFADRTKSPAAQHMLLPLTVPRKMWTFSW